MKKATKVGFIIAGICFGLGLFCVLVSFMLGGFRKNEVWATIREEGIHMNVGMMDFGEQQTFVADKAEVEKLDLEVGMGELHIETYSGDQYEVSYPKKYVKCSLSMDSDGNCLRIKSKKTFSLFRFIISGDPAITIRVPEKSHLKEASISTGAGEAEIERLKADVVYLDTGAGELTAEHLTATKKATIDAGVGETTIEDLQTGEGSFTVGVGELNISGHVDGDVMADCGVGEITLDLDNYETDFNYDVSCGAGSISINGHDYSGIGRSHESTHQVNGHRAAHNFDISCGVGSIEIYLKEE